MRIVDDGDLTAKGAFGNLPCGEAFIAPTGGDGQIVARVDSVQNTNAGAKAGVMIRDGLETGAAHVMIDVKPTGSAEFVQRLAEAAGPVRRGFAAFSATLGASRTTP